MYLTLLQILRANSINTEMAIKQAQVLHCFLLSIPLAAGYSCLLGLPFESSTVQVHSPVSAGPSWVSHTRQSSHDWETQSSCWKHCVFSSVSVYSTGLKSLCFYPSWFIFPLQTFLTPYYGVNLVSAYIIMVVMGIWAFFVAGGSCRSLKLCLLCQDKDFLLYNQRSR